MAEERKIVQIKVDKCLRKSTLETMLSRHHTPTGDPFSYRTEMCRSCFIYPMAGCDVKLRFVEYNVESYSLRFHQDERMAKMKRFVELVSGMKR